MIRLPTALLVANPIVCALVGSSVAAPQPAEAIGGTLFRHGGGALPPAVMEEFIALCDRPEGRLIIIPSAAADGQIDEFLECRSTGDACGIRSVRRTSGCCMRPTGRPPTRTDL